MRSCVGLSANCGRVVWINERSLHRNRLHIYIHEQCTHHTRLVCNRWCWFFMQWSSWCADTPARVAIYVGVTSYTTEPNTCAMTRNVSWVSSRASLHSCQRVFNVPALLSVLYIVYIDLHLLQTFNTPFHRRLPETVSDCCRRSRRRRNFQSLHSAQSFCSYWVGACMFLCCVVVTQDGCRVHCLRCVAAIAAAASARQLNAGAKLCSNKVKLAPASNTRKWNAPVLIAWLAGWLAWLAGEAGWAGLADVCACRCVCIYGNVCVRRSLWLREECRLSRDATFHIEPRQYKRETGCTAAKRRHRNAGKVTRRLQKLEVFGEEKKTH